MIPRSYHLSVSAALIGLILFLGGQAHAQIFEATSDGNWSSNSTWKSGTSPGPDLNVGEIVKITPNTTVTLDQDLTFVGSSAILKVNGTLQGSQNITINRGEIGGNNASGLLDVNKVLVQSSNVLNLAGELKANVLKIDAPANLVQNATLTVEDTLYLKSGSLDMGGSSTGNLKNGASIVITEGIMNGSAFKNNNYTLIYKGDSKASLSQFSGTLGNLIIELKNNSDSLLLTGNFLITNKLYLKKGNLCIDDQELTLNNIDNEGTGSISGGPKSKITVSGSIEGGFRFTNGKNLLQELFLEADATLSSDLRIVSSCILNNGKLMLKDRNLKLLDTALISNRDTGNYVFANGRGHLSMMAEPNDTTVFPVGTDSSYSPAHIMHQGNNATRYNVSVQNGVPVNGDSGDDLAKYTSLVNRTWFVNNEGNGNTNLDLKLAWTPQAEVNNFNRNNSYISHFNNGSWDSMVAAQAQATGNGTFAIERTGIQNLSPFAVHDKSTNTGKHEKRVANIERIDVYPNPVEETMVIELLEPKKFDKVKLYTISGRLIQSNKLRNKTNTSINVADLQEGIYILQAVGEQQVATTKVIKK